nr:molybdopterin-dependent oxidoreductase [Burkholderiaceae bacterium]
MIADGEPLDTAALLARAVPRPDASDKLAGRAAYPTDRLRAGQLRAVVVGSPHPHAGIESIDVSAARAMPGVRDVVTAADIPGPALFGLRHVDRPVLCTGKVRCIGDPVAAVAADTLEQAQRAAAAVRIVWRPLPVVDDMAAALEPDAEPVHAGGNLLHRCHHRAGDPARAAAATVHRVETTSLLPRQMPGYLETEGGVVEPDGQGGLVVHFGCQNPERDRQFIAAMLRLAPERVRVIGTPVGGSYGGKDELTVQPIAALLAWRTGRPVRLHLSRGESVDLGVKRHPMRVRMVSGCDAAGRLTLHEVDLLADTGAYATHGPEVLDAAQEHAVGPYRWQSVAIDGRLAYTNNGIAGAMRGFGAVQVQIALEQQIDCLARRAGLDAAAMRTLNLTAPDDPGPLGQQVVPFDGPRQVLEAVARHPLWRAPHDGFDGRRRRAVGLALVHRSDGYGRGGPNGGRLAFALADDVAVDDVAVDNVMADDVMDAHAMADGARAGDARAGDARAGDARAGDARAGYARAGYAAEAPDGLAAAPAGAADRIRRGRAVIEVRVSFTEMGQNLDGAIRAMAAEQFGCGPDRVRPVIGDSALAPDTGAVAASRATTMVHRALRDHGPRFASMIDAWLADPVGPRPVLTIDLPGEETPSDVPGAHYVFGAAAALAEVQVDGVTGAVSVERMVIATALGPVVSAIGYLGQIEGGALMGQGMVTTEDLTMQAGRYTARNLDGYLMPTMRDAPSIEVLAIESLPPGDPVGPRGAGEIGVNIGAAAVAVAIGRAVPLGATVRWPLAPERVAELFDG